VDRSDRRGRPLETRRAPADGIRPRRPTSHVAQDAALLTAAYDRVRIAVRARRPEHLAVVPEFTRLSFAHILPKGLGHILFVLGLFLLSARRRPAFTFAHTLTLGLSAYGVVSLPRSVVEPLIALSIAYVAVENVATSVSSGPCSARSAFESAPGGRRLEHLGAEAFPALEPRVRRATAWSLSGRCPPS
jgi:hypothetical protein